MHPIALAEPGGRVRETSRGADGPQAWVPWHDVLGWIESELKRAARRYALPANESDELRQQICLRVTRAVGGFDPDSGEATLETWVRKQAVWGVADYWRMRMRTERREKGTVALQELASGGDSPAQAAHRAELRAALEECLEKLTDSQRDRYLQTQKALDARSTLYGVARALRISRDTLKESVARARVLLRRCMARGGFAPLGPEPAPPSSGLNPRCRG